MGHYFLVYSIMLLYLDCARYAEVSTVAGTHWTDLGVQPGGAPVIFKLDVDANLTQDGDPYTSIYRYQFFKH